MARDMKILQEKLDYLRENEDYSVLYRFSASDYKKVQPDHQSVLKDKRGKTVILSEKMGTLHLMFTLEHEYELGPCLTEADVQKFEGQHGITLPDDYRQFLLEVGYGGAGPGYHLYTFDEGMKHTSWDDAISENVLRRPFRFTDYWCNYNDEFTFEENEGLTAAAYGGFLPIGFGGCTEYYVLVLNGPERGNMWLQSFGNDFGIAPIQLNDDTPRTQFFDWYNNWLDKQIADLNKRLKAK